MPNRCKRWSLAAGAACALMSAQVQAQQTTPSDEAAAIEAPAASQANELPEIIVTAQRRSQRLQDAPVAVSSFSNEDIEQTQSPDTLQLTRLVPNTVSGNNVGQASANVYYIRGLGQTQSFPTFEPQVGTYVNDVYISRQNANNFTLFDVSDVQILRGPQGTLFGRNSTGGAILVTLAPPARDFGGYVEASYGDRYQFAGRGSVNLPISSEVLTKTSFFGVTDDGYVRNLTTGENLNYKDNWGVRESVRLIPSENVVWDFSGDYSDNDQANLYNFLDGRGKRRSVVGFTTNGNTVGILNGDKANIGLGAIVKSYGASSYGLITSDAGTLSIITGYRGLDQRSALDFPDAAFGPLVPGDAFRTGQFLLVSPIGSNQYTQEVKWNGVAGPLNYTVGAYYLYETNQTNFGAVLNLGLGVPIALQGQTFRNTASSSAVYAQADYKITDELTATAGLRFTHEIKRISLSANGPQGFDNAAIQAAGYRTALTADQFTPKFGLQYQFAPDLMGYVSATRGFQGGGWNSLAFSAPTFNNFGPESVWSYEAGVHYESPAKDFRLNAAAFLEEVSRYQLLATSPVPGSFITENAADLENYGLEVDGSWIPLPDLTLTGTLGLQDAHYKNPTAVVQSQQESCRKGLGTGNAALIAGNCGSGIVKPNALLAEPQYVPPYTITFGAQYVAHYRDMTLTPYVAAQFVGRQSLDTADAPGGIDPPYASLDASLTYQLEGRPWTLALECRNCTFQNHGTSYLFGYKYLNDPGFWDVRFKYVF